MTGARLDYREEEREGPGGRATLLVLAGTLDSTTSPALEAVLARRAIQPGPQRLLVDFTALDFVSSAGWGVLVSHVQKFRAVGGGIRLAGMRRVVSTTHEMLDLASFLPAFATVEDALAAPW